MPICVTQVHLAVAKVVSTVQGSNEKKVGLGNWFLINVYITFCASEHVSARRYIQRWLPFVFLQLLAGDRGSGVRNVDFFRKEGA